MITRIFITAGALMLVSGAVAQTATHSGAHNPAVKNSTVAQVAAPAAGANSFSEDQARGRFAKAGYATITDLAKDKDGVWRAKTLQGGKTISVALDYKGNVSTN